MVIGVFVLYTQWQPCTISCRTNLKDPFRKVGFAFSHN